MCSMHNDESAIHVFIVARPSRLCVPFSKKLDNLIDCLDNRHTMYGFQCSALECVCGNRNDAYYCSIVMFHGL
jgi:hypothetical protein